MEVSQICLNSVLPDQVVEKMMAEPEYLSHVKKSVLAPLLKKLPSKEGIKTLN